MSSAQEQRCEIIQECVPQLIQQLTGFNADDPNLRSCETFAWSIIRNHRNLSTNSHDVRRRIEGIQERFRVENCSEFADYLGKLCDKLIRHPLCVDHYEIDVQWSLLDFLLTLAYKPVNNLKRNKHKIEIKSLDVIEEDGQEVAELISLKDILRNDFIEMQKFDETSSDLSEWSDNESVNDLTSNQKSVRESKSIDYDNNSCSTINSILKGIKPPQKLNPFLEFDGSNAVEQLQNLIQHSWWLTCAQTQINALVESTLSEANFSKCYNRFLNESSKNLVYFSEPSTITEQHLLREMIWLFHSPQSCAIFIIDKNSKICKKHNFTIPSLTENGLKEYLDYQFVPYMHMMDILKSFYTSIYNYENYTPPRTMECYAYHMHLLLSTVWDQLLAYEKRLIVQETFNINTMVNMRRCLDDSFKFLENLYDLHQMVVINWLKHPAHICSVYLLASLMQCFQMESNATRANLAMSLLLTAIKVFCEIIDTWWLEGRLDDWQEEFIVERVSNDDESVRMREFQKNKQKSFFVPTHVSNVITQNRLFHLMQEHCLEAGRTLNLLYEINRIGDLRNSGTTIKGKLYNIFIKDYLQQLHILQSTIKQQSAELHRTESVSLKDYKDNNDQDEILKQSQTKKNKNKNEIENENENILKHLTTTDDFLLKVFALNSANSDMNHFNLAEDLENETAPNALEIFQQLQECSCILPLEELLINILTRILKNRIAFANSFILKLYREEFMLLKHLRNIRKILLLEASDLMHQFYTKLFNQIETSENWANPSLLTMQLDDIICTKFPEMSSIFRIEVNSTYRCQTNKVYDAVDELTIIYNFNRELAHIITADDLVAYNQVFRFLLKVKWGITTLEKLRFPRTEKNRIPYAVLGLADLVMRRLQQLRFWLMYSVNNVHFHLMTHVLQAMGEQLDLKIAECRDIREIEMVHKYYLSTVCEHCFLVEDLNPIKIGIEQLLSLICILRLEWNSCVTYLENDGPLAISLTDDDTDDTDSSNYAYPDTAYISNSQIDAIEMTYIRCHQYLANKLNNEVYLKKKAFISGLSASFNTSLPY